MLIHKMSITTLETGFLVQDETDPDDPHPLAGFGAGQLLNALSYVRDSMEYEMGERAKELEMLAAKHRGDNVVPGPGWTPPPGYNGNAPTVPEAAHATISRPVKTDREIVDEVNAVAFTVLRLRGYDISKTTQLWDPKHRDNSRLTTAWAAAAELYQQITGSEVSDALEAVLEDLQAAAAPAVPEEPAR